MEEKGADVQAWAIQNQQEASDADLWGPGRLLSTVEDIKFEKWAGH